MHTPRPRGVAARIRSLTGNATTRSVLLVCVTAFIVSAATATASSLITGKDVKDGSLTGRDIKAGSISLNRLSAGSQSLIKKGLTSPSPVIGSSTTPGNQGETGQAGATGPKGDNGAKGDQGDKGDKGDKGDQGDTGAQGLPGQNADGSYTTHVTKSGDGGFTVGGVAGSGGNNGSATIESGRLRLKVNSPGGGFAEAGKTYNNVPLSDIDTLIYRYQRLNAGNNAVAPVLKLDVIDATPCSPTGGTCGDKPLFAGNSTTLVYEPTYSDSSNPDAATVDALGSGNKWWSTRDANHAFEADSFTADGLQTLQSILGNNPNMKVVKIYLQAGQNSQGAPWSGFDGAVDYLNIGIAGADTDRFDFGL